MGLPTNSIQSSKQTLDFNTTKNKKLIDMVSDFTLPLTSGNYYLLNWGVVYPKLP